MKQLTAWLLLLILLLTTAFASESVTGTDAAADADTTPRLPDKVLLSFYDNSLFFGDSIMQGLSRYKKVLQKADKTFMKTAPIYAAQSISLYTASRPTVVSDVAFLRRGAKKTMYSITKELQPDKIFILLGLNDPVVEKIDKAIGWVEYLIKTMATQAPGVKVHFFSLTPVTPYYCQKRNRPAYPELADQYNQRLRETCEQYGAYYIEIAEALKDPEGYLNAAYSSDGDCHLNDEGNAVWLQCMYDYAQQQYELGLWTPVLPEDNATTDTE